MYEQEGQSAQFSVADPPPREGAKEKEVVETELPVTPSAGLPKMMVTSPIQVDDLNESPARADPSSSQAPICQSGKIFFQILC